MKNDMQVVSALEVIEFSGKSRRMKQFAHVYEAIDKLSRIDERSGIKFHRKGLKEQIACKKAHIYARTFNMAVITRNSGDYMMIARRPEYKHSGEMEAKLLQRELAVKSNTERKSQTTQQPGTNPVRGRGVAPRP